MPGTDDTGGTDDAGSMDDGAMDAGDTDGATHPCCTTVLELACEEPTIVECVCATEAAELFGCCSGQWSPWCAVVAAENCAAECS